MHFPTLFNFKGYTNFDPHDTQPAWLRYFILAIVNAGLTILLVFLLEKQKILYFNGFELFGFYFSEKVTKGIGLFIIAIILSFIIISLRKASSVLFFLILFIPFFIPDIFIESQYRCTYCSYDRALWNYYDHEWINWIDIPALRSLLVMGIFALVIGVFGLFISRIIALLLSKNLKPSDPSKKQYKELFNQEWAGDDVKKPKRDLSFWILRLLGFGYLAYLTILLLGIFGSSPWPDSIGFLMDMTYENPALAINTYFKISLMIMFAFIGAFNKQLRFHCASVLLVGHLVSTVFSLAFYFWRDDLKSTYFDFLLTSAILDGVMIAIFLFILFKHKSERKKFEPENAMPIHFSVPMTLMQKMFKTLCILFLAGTITILLIRIFTKGATGISAVYGSPDPMLGNTLTLYGTLAFIFFILVREKLRQHFYNPVLFPFVIGAALALLWLIIGGIFSGIQIKTKHGTFVSADWYFVLFATVNILLCLLLRYLRKLYYKVDHSINSLNPASAVNCMALANAFFNADDKQQASVLRAVDLYTGGITGRKRGLLNLPFSLFENTLSFLFGFRPAFSSMSREEQRFFLRKYFLRNELERKQSGIPYLAEFAYQVGTTLNSISMFANYSYINERFAAGYIPADARDRLQGDEASYSPPHSDIAPLPKDEKDPNNFKKISSASIVAPRVTTPVQEQLLPEEVDYMIIGSGAGGAVMAYRLSGLVSDPARILVIERGNRYQPLQDFEDSEMGMMKKIYKEGGLQQTKRYAMTVLQGECVGGTTVANNAVCFRIPDNVKKQWENEFGLNLDDLDSEYDKIAKELNIQPLGDRGVNRLVKQKFIDAVQNYNATILQDEKLLSGNDPVLVNHLNNVGDGNWNLGNKRMRKRSMLETYLPWAESKGVKIIPNLTAVRFMTSSPNSRKVDCVLLRTDNGGLKKVRVNKAIILAGGAISSSHFLMRSEVKNQNIGKRLSCNFAFPVAFQFEEIIKAYDGEQITMAALDPKNRSAFETYFNPPASFALSSIPFFFNRRDEMMKKYSSMINFGALVGSEPNGEVVKKADLLNGMAFSWKLGENDTANIKYAITTLVKLGKSAGALKAFLPTKPGIQLDLKNAGSVENFCKTFNSFPLRMTDMFLGTAHPQGGNICVGSTSEKSGMRVIDEDFRLDGYDNVFVTDASVFPTSITINPQWTIMALSSTAAKKIAVLK